MLWILDYLVWKPNTLFSIFKTSFWQTLWSYQIIIALVKRYIVCLFLFVFKRNLILWKHSTLDITEKSVTSRLGLIVHKFSLPEDAILIFLLQLKFFTFIGSFCVFYVICIWLKKHKTLEEVTVFCSVLLILLGLGNNSETHQCGEVCLFVCFFTGVRMPILTS